MRPQRLIGTLGSVSLGALLCGVPLHEPAAAGTDRTFVASGEWRMERFGADVAILRLPLRPDGTTEANGSITLTCEGEGARLRIDFPGEEVGIRLRPYGRALLRAYGSGRGGAVVFAVAWGQGRTLTSSGDRLSQREAVRGVLDLLRLRPASLDLLLAPSGDGPDLVQSRPFHLKLGSFQVDPASLDGFAAPCGLGRAEDGGRLNNRSR